jgi:hypothetical protein
LLNAPRSESEVRIAAETEPFTPSSSMSWKVGPRCIPSFRPCSDVPRRRKLGVLAVLKCKKTNNQQRAQAYIRLQLDAYIGTDCIATRMMR